MTSPTSSEFLSARLETAEYSFVGVIDFFYNKNGGDLKEIVQNGS